MLIMLYIMYQYSSISYIIRRTNGVFALFKMIITNLVELYYREIIFSDGTCVTHFKLVSF